MNSSPTNLDYATNPADEVPPRAASPRRLLSSLSPILIALLFDLGYALFIGFPKYPVADASERIAYSSIAAAILAIAASLIASRVVRFFINLLALIVCVVPTLLPLVRPGDLTYGSLALWTAAVCVPVAIFATRMHCLRDRGEALLTNLVTLGMTLAGGALLLSTGSLKLGQAGFSLAGGVLLVTIAGLFVKRVGDSWGTSTIVFAVLAGLFTSGYVWSELPLYAGLCVWAAVPLAWIARVPVLARRKTWVRVVITLLIAAMPAATAVSIEAVKANRAAQESADEYGY